MIEKFESKDFLIINKIAELCFGEGYFESSLLQKAQFSSYIYKNPINLDEIVGFCTFEICNADEINPAIQSKHKIAIIQSLAFLPDYRLKGYGSELLKFVCNRLKSKGISEVYYHAWVESNHAYFENKLMKIGFKHFETILNYWKGQSIEKQFSCIRCGTPPCLCTLNVYVLNQ